MGCGASTECTPPSDSTTSPHIPAQFASVVKFYDSDGDPIVGSFTNSKGLKVVHYTWVPSDVCLDATSADRESVGRSPTVKGHVFLVHGYAGHARFEWLKHDLPDRPNASPVMSGSWVERFTEAGYVVSALDLQSFGCSEGWGGNRASVEEVDDLTRDVIQWITRLRSPVTKGELDDHIDEKTKARLQNQPAFLLGISLGGYIVIRAIQLLNMNRSISYLSSSPKNRSSISSGSGTMDGILADNTSSPPTTASSLPHSPASPDGGAARQPPIDGVIALCPMLSLEKLKKKLANRVLLPIAGIVSSFAPHLAIAEKEVNTNHPECEAAVDADPLTYKGKARARFAHSVLEAVDTVQRHAPHVFYRGEEAASSCEMVIPLLLVHSKHDTMCDPEGSKEFFKRVEEAYDPSDTAESEGERSERNSLSMTVKKGKVCELWELDSMWHFLSKEPETSLLQEQIIDNFFARVNGNCDIPLEKT
eukprot:GHVS01036175.1.p1 GENE.GHVS01036175.1~~GHVS01036175.1.p1  ORF type:complete len:477 (+),score=56.16 GHVS01036175.1:132-1562(+)